MQVKFKDQKGLSVIELITAMAVFLLVMGVAVSLLILFLRNPALVLKRNNMEKNMQNIMEQMVTDFRNYQVDYDYYGGTIPSYQTTDTLALLDNDGNQILYTYDDVTDTLSYTNGSTFVELNNKDVTFPYLFFNIQPKTSPWSETDPVDEQPTVFIYMMGETANPYSANSITFKLQTAVVSRKYFR
ncbi:MAG: hypothetical protein ABH835_01820 [Patescibacteria group bacterium]